jgi:hypothetical protein
MKLINRRVSWRSMESTLDLGLWLDDSIQIHAFRMRQLPTNPILAALTGNVNYRFNRRISKGLTVAASPGTRPIDLLLNHPPDPQLDTSPVISTPEKLC